MVTDRLTRAVREQLALGRLLPLGGPGDASWVVEQAARNVLRRVESEVPGARLGSLRIGLADPEHAARPTVPAPVSALPPGPLRIGATCVAVAGQPLPAVARELRAGLHACATRRLGLVVDAIDLRVTELLEELPPAPGLSSPPGAAGAPEVPPSAKEPEFPPAVVALAAAARGVPGVVALAPVLGGAARAVRVEDRTDARGAPIGRHVEVQLAVAGDHGALEVARAVRAAVARTVAAPVTVAVVVTDVT
ncbi:nucleopolyhedrovirus P10 family protein [Streptomyces sp. NPDC018031]|uniref:nucleopolyhedrovirus P10 family protein n=1 Tax=Streptomyces sp. NPDC018031 TaxID=3365033 RepID=UPI0037ABBE6E